MGLGRLGAVLPFFNLVLLGQVWGGDHLKTTRSDQRSKGLQKARVFLGGPVGVLWAPRGLGGFSGVGPLTLLP